MRKQATGKKRKIYAEIVRLLPVTVLRFTLLSLKLSVRFRLSESLSMVLDS